MKKDKYWPYWVGAMSPKYNSSDVIAIAARIMAELPYRDREVLRRFYLLRHTAEEIQEALGIDAGEFSDIKSRARARFFDIIAGRNA